MFKENDLQNNPSWSIYIVRNEPEGGKSSQC